MDRAYSQVNSIMEQVASLIRRKKEATRTFGSTESYKRRQIEELISFANSDLLGDGKYGVGSVNRKYGETHQALYSYRLRFDFPSDAGILEYLHGREFQVDEVPFQKKYFS